MKNICYLLAVLTVLVWTTEVSAQEPKKTTEPTKTEAPALNVEQFSYAYGAMFSKRIAQFGFSKDEKNIDRFIEGMKEGLKGDKKAFDNAQGLLRKRIQTKTVFTDVKAAGEVAYSLGLTNIGGLAAEIKIPESDFDFDAFKKGFTAAEEGKELTMKEPEMNALIKAYFEPKNEAYRKAVQAKAEAEAAQAIKEGEAFMKENGLRPTVKTLPSGVQYEVIKATTGTKPTINDKVRTHYHGTLINGKVFDSSVERGEPITFPLNSVIKGWQEGIPLMSVGSKYRFYIPQELAYGMRSPSPKIPAGSTLIFEVELFEIIPQGNAQPQKSVQSPATEQVELGKAFMEANAKKPGVKTLENGIQYIVLVEGDGPKPKVTDNVTVHYHGTLINGTVFDSSVERGQPATFNLQQLIKGWQIGIPLMPVGSKYRFFIPQQYAYGMTTRGKIPGGATLIFDIELFNINGK